ncbi:Ig-like domain-containing protein [Pseudomonas cichorii]|uniref:Ig-like domain-containing protein n=1 Tax=Pseudomonas cichorii TaxID=36746 RepID=UPI001E63359A|nr:Ig-like domain-containing protein [Pseudomonas cichorii]
MNTSLSPRKEGELDAPEIPAALENGVLPIEFLGRPVIVKFKVWEGARPGYIYRLLWDGWRTGPDKQILDNQLPGDELTLEIPVALLTEGVHQVAYETFNPESQIVNSSEKTHLEIDRTAPGNPHLGPILFPAFVDDGLTSDELENVHNVLRGSIASYNGMKEGDVIRTYWNQVPGPITMVNKDDMGLQRVNVDFVRSFLETIGDIEAPVHYTVTDQAGNLSMESQARLVKLQLSILPDLPAPTVKEANGDILDPVNAINGATIQVGTSANLAAGERLTVQWQGPKGSDTREKIITPADVGKVQELLFAAALVNANAGQTVAVSYTVNRLNGTVQPSAILALKVLDARIDLPAPGMDTVGPDGVVIPSKIPESGATVRVAYTGMSPGDSVVVNWRGATAYDTPSQTVGANTELQFTLAKALIVASRAATVTYTVTRAGTASLSSTLWLKISKELEFDTSSVVLKGKVYLLPGYPDLLPAMPSDTTVQRTASGGQAPYTYRSSDPLVAKVDGNGLTSARGKGTAIISVTDSLGAMKSYQVTVTGVIHCLGIGAGSFTKMAAAAEAQGARIPSIYELNEIHSAYGRSWPMGHGNYWSCTVAMTNLVGWKWYYVKNLVTGADFKLLHHNASLGVAIR